MAKVFPFYHPFLIPDGDEEALEQRKVVYDPTTPEAERYVNNDLVTLATGVCRKETEATTPANLGPLALAGHDWNQPFAVSDKRDPAATAPFLDNVFVNIIRHASLFVFSYQFSKADGTPHIADSTDIAQIASNARRELKYNATENCLTIREGVANPNVIMMEPFNGAKAGDTNIPVLCKILPEFLAG